MSNTFSSTPNEEITNTLKNARERDKDRIQKDMPIPLARQRDKEGPDLSEEIASITVKGSQIAAWLDAECRSEKKEKISKSYG